MPGLSVLARVNIYDIAMHLRILEHLSYKYYVFVCDTRARHIGKLQRAAQRPTPSLVFSVVRHAPVAMLLFSISKVVGSLDTTSLPGRLRLPSISCTRSKPSSLLASSGGSDVIIHVDAPQLFFGHCHSHKPGANYPSAANMSRSPRDSKTPGVQIVR